MPSSRVLLAWGCRSRCTPCAASGRSARPGAFSPRMSSTQRGDRGHDPVGRLVHDRRASAGWSRRSSRSTGSPTFIVIVLRGNRSGFFAYGARISCAPHCADRDHRAAGLERDPRGAGLAGHRPQVGVAGDACPRGRPRRTRPRRTAATAASKAPTALRAQPLDRDLAARRAGTSRAPCSRTGRTSPGSAAAGRGRRRSARR